MKGVLALPPAIRGEEQEAEQVTETRVHPPGCEQRVVREVVKKGVHAHEEDRGGQSECHGEPGAGTEEGDEGPEAEVSNDDPGDLPEAATGVDCEVGGEVLLPGRPAWGDRAHGEAFAAPLHPDHRLARPCVAAGSGPQAGYVRRRTGRSAAVIRRALRRAATC